MVDELKRVVFTYGSGKTVILEGRALDDWNAAYQLAVAAYLQQVRAENKEGEQKSTSDDTPTSLRQVLQQ